MTGKELVGIALDIQKRKTLYVLGGWGQSGNDAGKKYALETATEKARKFNNRQSDETKPGQWRKPKILAADAETLFFDCVGLIKYILWGGNGNTRAVYASNNVPDTNANGMIKLCKNVGTDFDTIKVGEAVWVDGHIGLYIGDGLTVECTYTGTDGVQIRQCRNVKYTKGQAGRYWTKHGELPTVDYEAQAFKNLKVGSSGTAVKVWQTIVGVTADGMFGGKTKDATIELQKKLFPNDSAEWDGVVGKKTLNKAVELVFGS